MALVKLGSIITEISGKIGGQVIQRGRAGQTMMNLGRPPRSQSNATSERKSNFSNVATTWRGLAPSDVAAWNALASTMTRLNKFGDSYVPTGFQIYQEFSLNATLFGAFPLASAPPSFDILPVVTGMTVNATAGPNVGGLNWTYSSGGTGFVLAIYVLGISGGSRAFIGTSPLYLVAMAHPTDGTAGFYGFLPVYYQPQWIAGRTVYLAYRWIHEVYGYSGPLLYINGVIV
jgi:hypothetical protein